MLSTDAKTQSLIVALYESGLAQKNIKIVKSSRGGKHLRFSYQGDHKKLLNDIIRCELTDSTYVISGKYRTEELTIKESTDGAKIGDKIYVVNAVSSRGELRTKELTPERIGVATGKKIARSEFKRKVIQGIDDLGVSVVVKEFMKDLMDSAETTSGKIKSEYIDQISDSDINTIAKDFGEVSGAWWFLNVYDKTADGIMYPTQSNLRLIDYYATYPKKPNLAISAKAGKGAPPSIDAIADILDKINYTDSKKKIAKNLIISIRNNSVLDGIIRGSAEVKTPGWNALIKLMGSNITPASIEIFLSKYKTADELLIALDPLYKIMGRAASPDITKRIVGNRAKRNGLILSPLAYHLVDMMNADKTYSNVLNEATKQINVSQLYINIYKTQRMVKYHIQEFKDIDFKFEYNGNAGMPGLKKISFKAK
jgi:hypothetical protein